jgi:hypothetical protein
MVGMTVKTKWWWPYLGIQAIGLFHFFYPLPFHYRHTIGKWASLPVLPGVSIAWVADLCIREHSLTQISIQRLEVVDYCFIIVITELINCGVFALAVWLINGHRERRIRRIAAAAISN